MMAKNKKYDSGSTEKGDGVSRRVRLEDIALRCGTSLSTVSRALSGEKGVGQALRARILEVARAVRYSPAQEMVGSRIVLAVSQVAMLDYHRYQFSWYVLQGLRERAKVLGLELVTHPLSDTGMQSLTDLLNQEDIGGMLALTVDDPAILDVVVNLKKPAVLVNSEDPLMRLSSVQPCNRSATRMASDYLVARGHRDILFLTHPGRRTIEQRREGWHESMRHFQLPCSEQQVLTVTDWLPELAEQAVVDWFQAQKRTCTAILCANDSLALGAISGLQRLGLAVPGDVSVIGMNDLPQAEFSSPPLTTVHLPVHEIGVIALELLQDIIAGNVMIPRRIELACAMNERQSVASVPSD